MSIIQIIIATLLVAFLFWLLLSICGVLCEIRDLFRTANGILREINIHLTYVRKHLTEDRYGKQ